MERISRLPGSQNIGPACLSASGSGANSALTHLRYTQTRKVILSREALRRQRIITGYGPCPFVDAFKVLRARVLQRMRERGWNTLGITGAGTGCGKTLTAINLAISCAMEIHQSVLLVDANLRSPNIHRRMGFQPPLGLNDLLDDDTPLQRILVNPDGLARFVLLPGRRPMAHATEILGSPRMARLVEEMKSRYASRFVFFDLPPVGTPDVVSFSPLLDAILLVVEEGQTSHHQMAGALESLGETPLLGIVLNRAEDAQI